MLKGKGYSKKGMKVPAKGPSGVKKPANKSRKISGPKQKPTQAY